jgi:hypothetical protein
MSIGFTPIGSVHSKARNIAIQKGKTGSIASFEFITSEGLRKDIVWSER